MPNVGARLRRKKRKVFKLCSVLQENTQKEFSVLGKRFSLTENIKKYIYAFET